MEMRGLRMVNFDVRKLRALALGAAAITGLGCSEEGPDEPVFTRMGAPSVMCSDVVGTTITDEFNCQPDDPTGARSISRCSDGRFLMVFGESHAGFVGEPLRVASDDEIGRCLAPR